MEQSRSSKAVEVALILFGGPWALSQMAKHQDFPDASGQVDKHLSTFKQCHVV
jgi:hypothetical protein